MDPRHIIVVIQRAKNHSFISATGTNVLADINFAWKIGYPCKQSMMFEDQKLLLQYFGRKVTIQRDAYHFLRAFVNEIEL